MRRRRREDSRFSIVVLIDLLIGWDRIDGEVKLSKGSVPNSEMADDASSNE